MFEQLHQGMKARFHFNGSLSEPIAIDNGVKQGDISAPTLFSIYVALTLYNSKLLAVFKLARVNAKSRIFQTFVRDLLKPNDADFIAHAEEDIQEIMNLFSGACTAFGLSINLEKTCTLVQMKLLKDYGLFSEIIKHFEAWNQN